LNAYDFASEFVRYYFSNAIKSNQRQAAKLHLFTDIFYEENVTLSGALHRVWALWLLDPRNSSAPGNAKPELYEHLDPISIMAYWSRQFTTPIVIDTRSNGSNSHWHWIASGYVYDLRSMSGFEPPLHDVKQITRDLLYEASALRKGSIPYNAFVEVNFPPFVALVFYELGCHFVLVEALDEKNRSLPIHLFPNSLRWTAPNTGCGPSDDYESFKQVRDVLVVISAAILRDFWVIEDRQGTLGPPRISRILGSKNFEKRIIYLPRIRHIGGKDLAAKLEKTFDITARAAHWRREHYRKLPDGHQPTRKQLSLAKAFDRYPPPGFTWVKGTSVAGEEAERVYRSRSVSSILFDIIPSKGRVLDELTWFEFEDFCTSWLKSSGFEEAARASRDKGVDITAFSTEERETIVWAVQCKHWSKKVGPNVVRELEGARKSRDADRAMLIVSSAFTPAAIQTANELGIRLVDGDVLMKNKNKLNPRRSGS
jgi:hypothetical protein